MKLPRLYARPPRRSQQILDFAGLNCSESASPGELVDSRGLSSDKFPALSQRAGRSTVTTLSAPSALFGWHDKLCYVDDGDLYYGDFLLGRLTPGAKHFAVVGTKLCIFPDKQYIDLADPDNPKLGWLQYSVDSSPATISPAIHSAVFACNSLDLTPTGVIDTISRRALIPDDSGFKWWILAYDSVSFDSTSHEWTTGTASVVGIDDNGLLSPNGSTLLGKYIIPLVATAGEFSGSYVYNAIIDYSAPAVADFSSDLNSVGVYGKITNITTAGASRGDYAICMVNLYDGSAVAPHINDIFAVGDTVQINGCDTLTPDDNTVVYNGENNKLVTIRAISIAVDDRMTLYFDPGQFVAGYTDSIISVSRNVPDLDFICESDNRLWGVHGNIIYASALGSPANFYTFDNTASDSYSVAVATDGDFTGCISYSSAVLCFKPHCLHKVIGKIPSEFSYSTYDLPGVQAGSDKSMIVINEVLYYKGIAGLYAYTGGVPELISTCFGVRRFASAVAGSDDAKYYVSMADDNSNWHMFAFDTLHGVWLREDDTRAVAFAKLGTTMYFIDYATCKIMAAGQDYSEEGRIDWLASFAPLTEYMHNRKCYSTMSIRAEIAPGAWMQVFVSCDDEPWRLVGIAHNSLLPTVTVRFKPVRCDSFRMKLVGKGLVTLKSIVREYEIGSEV